jgi:DnaJ domain
MHVGALMEIFDMLVSAASLESPGSDTTIHRWMACGLLTFYFFRRYNRRLAEFEREDRFDTVDNANDGARLQDDRSNYTEEDHDPYQVLNVSSGASAEDIKNAYRAAIKRCHPDTVADRSDRIKEAALEEAQLINDAYNRIRSERGFSQP